ncbi:MAG: hypothetical protein KatS3mg057_0963 [Herpetosiphonaceae bacterium]|nr:MAG: hypothetical protein KatS3mg057_0963 [Herpetosiphonaceae bacterium]
MSDRLLYLIRHAPVTLLPDRPAPEWPLTGEGRALAERLAEAPVWRNLELVASSPEAKALNTAEPIAAAAGLTVRIEEELREVRREGTPVVGWEAYKAMVAAFFASPGQSVHGWEPGGVARQRIVSCINRLLAETQGSLALVSHGLILSLYLASLTGLDIPNLEEWAAIPLPAVAIVDPSVGRVVAPFVSVEGFLEGFR